MRLYQALLYLYPSSFRAEYGAEMLRVYRQRRRNASGFLVLVLWIDVLLDFFVNAAAAHLDILRQDLRYARRTLAQAPGFTLTAITVVALGIGATTAAFTMVDHVLIRPLPFPHSDRLVKLFEGNSGAPGGWNDVSPANYRDWKRMSSSFEPLAAYRGLSVNLIGQGDPQRLDGASLTWEVLPALDVKPLIGRIFSAEDDRESSAGTVILSYRLWRDAFGGDRGVLGRKLLLDGAPFTVIGVMPEQFRFPNRSAQLWTAMRFAPDDFAERTNTYIYGIARLKPGVSLQQASAEMRAISARLAASYPKELAHVIANVVRLQDELSPQSRLALMVLLAAAGCVLLVACMNLANLLLARAMLRKRELAVRAAMGAGRERLVRQMLTESLLLALAGGTLGVGLAMTALPLLVRLVPTNLPIADVPPIDTGVLLFALALTSATGILFGVFPALRVAHGQESAGLRETSRAGGGRRERLRSALVMAEVAGSMVLLVTCGLLVRALWRIQSVDPGFRPENVLTLRTSLPMPKYEKAASQQQFYERVLSEVRRLPGVSSAAYTSFLPMVHRGGVWPVEIAGRPQDLAERQIASLRYVTPGFFATLGIPLRTGRDVSESDTLKSPMIAVVSESFVRRYWPGENPLGRRFNFGNADRIVAGVVGDVRVRGLERASEPQVYLPYRQWRDVSSWYAPKDLAVRASGNPASLAPAIRRIIRDADPEQPIDNVQLLSDIVSSETATRRVQLSALGSFALIAFLLAAIGIHGLLSFAVSSRTQEIGVRLALGAAPGDILRMIVRDGAALAVAGILVGLAFAWGAGRELQSLLAGVRPTDWASFGAAVVLCLGMTLAGSVVPAVHAARIDPAVAIRTE